MPRSLLRGFLLSFGFVLQQIEISHDDILIPSRERPRSNGAAPKPHPQNAPGFPVRSTALIQADTRSLRRRPLWPSGCTGRRLRLLKIAVNGPSLAAREIMGRGRDLILAVDPAANALHRARRLRLRRRVAIARDRAAALAALRLLGEVELMAPAGPTPSRAVAQCMEYCAWLLSHPGATPTTMARDTFGAVMV